MTAIAWLALLVIQSWSAHTRRVAWHRAAGFAVFAIVPLFAAAGMFAVRDMAAEMNAGSPFEAFAAPALAPDDLSSIVAFVSFVTAALATRRRGRRHAAWMLATALLILPPLTTRLLQVVARITAIEAPSLWTSFVLGTLVSMGIALFLAYSRREDARPFIVLALLCMVKIGCYPIFEANAGWRGLLAALGNSPPIPSAAAAAAVSLAALIFAWRSVPPKCRVVPRQSTIPRTAAPGQLRP